MRACEHPTLEANGDWSPEAWLAALNGESRAVRVVARICTERADSAGHVDTAINWFAARAAGAGVAREDVEVALRWLGDHGFARTLIKADREAKRAAVRLLVVPERLPRTNREGPTVHRWNGEREEFETYKFNDWISRSLESHGRAA